MTDIGQGALVFDVIGLSTDAELAYRTLLPHPPLTRREVGEVLAGWSSPRLTRALDELQSAGFVTVRTGRSARYAVTAPDVAIESALRRRDNERTVVAASVPDLMKEYASAYPAPDVDFIEVLPVGDAARAQRRMDQLMAAVTRSVRALDRPPYPPFVTHDAAHDEPELTMLERGIDVRVVYDQEVVADPDRWPDLQTGVEAGENARTIVGLPSRLGIFDDDFATMPVVSAAGEWVTTMIVHSSPLLLVLAAYFEEVWRRAVPLGWSSGVPGPDPGEPSRDERLMTLLAAGVSDDVIARRLGVSASTVQRGVRGLLTELGARTRFQAGVVLGRRGTDRQRPEAP